MTFVYRECPVIGGEADLLDYWNKYWSLPEQELLAHNYYFRYYRDEIDMKSRKIKIVEDKSKSLVILFIHGIVSNPDEYAPSVYAVFIDNEIFIVKVASNKSHFTNEEKTEKKIIYKLMTYSLPSHLSNKQDHIKNIIKEAFIFWGLRESWQLIKVIDAEVIFDQPFIPNVYGR